MTTQHVSPAHEAIPEPVASLAAAQRLGAHRTTHLPQRASGAMIVFMFIGVVLGLALLVVPGVLLLRRMLTYLPNFSRKQAAKRLHVFEHGLIVAGLEGPVEALRYDSIGVLQDLMDLRVNGTRAASIRQYNVLRPDGSVLHLKQFYAHPERWGPELQRDVTAVQLPLAQAALREGRPVAFGDLTLAPAGITVPKGTAPWHDVQRVGVENGVLVVHRAGASGAWWRKPVAKVPNVFMLMELVEQLRRP
ncbi:DUF6585 family protein [Streptomyces mayteni]